VKKLLITLIICFSVLNISCAGLSPRPQAEAPPYPVPVVILYSADWCWWCEKAETFLIDNKIQYVNRDIEDPDMFKKLEEIAKKLNYERNLGIVPLFIVGRDMIPGFDPISVMASLEKAKWFEPREGSLD
jgi:glutaredoxin